MEQKKKQMHKGHRQRLKDKAREIGIESWPYHEILELALTYSVPYKDVNPLAHELIDTFGTFSGVLDAGYEQLMKVNGIGKETALFLSLLPDMFAKYNASKNVGAILLDDSHKCVRYFMEVDRVGDNETFYVFCLNAKKELVKRVKFNSNFPSVINFPMSWFTEKIVSIPTKSIIVMHSHPNGICDPTDADVEATSKLIQAALTLGIKFDDHVIVADRKYYSFSNSGLLRSLKDKIKSMGFNDPLLED